MKLLLTSNGLSTNNLKKEFVKIIKQPEKTRVLVMRTTSKGENDDEYFQEIKKELNVCKIKPENIQFINLKSNITPKDLPEFDVLWSCGGNTFIILDLIRKTGFDKLILDSIKSNKLYVGTSAGTIILSPSIELAGWGKEADENYIKLKDLTGLNVIKTAYFPHFRQELKQEVNQFKTKVNYPIEELEDGEAILIQDDKVKKIK